MNLLHRLRNYINPPSQPKLRNKPGGMAWVNRGGENADARAIVGSVVRTVRLVGGDMWLIDPPLRYPVTIVTVWDCGTVALPGDIALIGGMVDGCLTPIDEPGDEAKDESLAWLPKVPSSIREEA